MSAGFRGDALAVVRRDGSAWTASSPHAPGWTARAETFFELRSAISATLPNASGEQGIEVVFDTDSAVALVGALAGWSQSADPSHPAARMDADQATRILGGENPTEVLGGE